MKHQLLVFASIGLIVFFALLNVDVPSLRSHSLTGAVVDDSKEMSAFVIDDVVKRFFNVHDIDFPDDACGRIANDLYIDAAFSSIDDTAGFATSGNERLASINFVTHRTERVGTLDMLHISDGLKKESSLISMNLQSSVWIPRSVRSNFMVMDLYGWADDVFHVTRGRFSTPSVDCFFVEHYDDVTCDCEVHSISGISIAGITSYQPPDEYYDVLAERARIEGGSSFTVK